MCQYYTVFSSFLLSSSQAIPNFGPYKAKKEALIAAHKQKTNLLAGANLEKEEGREVDSPKYGVPPIKDMIGRALSMVGTYGDLDNTQQKVALIDEVSVNPKVRWYKW